MREVAVIGGGAAGFFAAVSLKELHRETHVVIYEKSSKVLTKVGLSGGGRCNLSNTFERARNLGKVYPRGFRLMQRLFHEFSPQETHEWFENHGVALTEEDEGRMFPQSQDSQTIVNLFVSLSRKYGVEVQTDCKVISVERNEESPRLTVHTSKGSSAHDAVIVTTGGDPQGEGYKWLEKLGHQIEIPCPSLFTFSIDNVLLHSMTGLSVKDVTLRLAGTKLDAQGDLLITHWGVSGPAVLKLSAYAARHLAEQKYQATLVVGWLGDVRNDKMTELLNGLRENNLKANLLSRHPDGLQKRLWEFLLSRSNLNAESRWADLSNKAIARLADTLTSDTYQITGKGRWKDEFVTCGGVNLKDINPRTMESRVCPGLYFAGEIIDVDGVTGGFNLQAAWTTGMVAANGVLGQIQSC